MKTQQFIAGNPGEIKNLLSSLQVAETDLAIIFSDKSFLLQPEIREAIKSKFSPSQLIGCSTSGGIQANELFDGTFILNLVSLKHTRFKKASVTFQNTSESFKTGKELVSKLLGPDLKHILVFSDGYAINGSRLVEGMNATVTQGVTISGGLAGDNADFNSTRVCNESNDFMENTVTAIGLYGDRVKISCGSFGGWEEFGIERVVTKSVENVVYEIDGKPALDLYKTYLGDKAKDLPSSALLFPLSFKEKENHEPLVRTILSVNEENKSMVFAGNIPQGAHVKLMKTATNNLVNMLELSEKMARFQGVKDIEEGLVLMVSCIGRKLVLKQLTQDEIEAVVNRFNPHFKFTGFYSYGEIYTDLSNEKNEATYTESCALNNQSMTITSITEF
jgi:hypothetical protein